MSDLFYYRLQKHMFMHIKCVCVCVCLTDMPIVQSLSSIEGLWGIMEKNVE